MTLTEGGRIGRLMSRVDQYRDWAALVTRATGKSALAQMREIRALRQLGGGCGISDYYWYRLYDESYLEGRGAADFLGWKHQGHFSQALNPRFAVLPAWDKTVFMQMAGAAGLPVAPVRACFHPAKKISPALGIHLRSRAEVAAFLRDPAIYPLFGKPGYSQQGYGSASFASYESEGDQLVLLNGKKIGVEEFVRRMDEAVEPRYHRPECGYLFQDTLKLAPEIQALSDWTAICGVRIACLNDAQGVQPLRAVWKLAVPPNHVDNFSLGKYGNLLANVDLATGTIGKVISAFWPKTQIHAVHPLSGKPLEGFQLPQWPKLLQAVRDAGPVFPLMKIHHWDFALTDQGPLMLELNDLGATEMLQVHGHGLLTPATREFLKRHANPAAHPWIANL